MNLGHDLGTSMEKERSRLRESREGVREVVSRSGVQMEEGQYSVAWRIPDESSEGDSPRVRPTNPSGTFTQDSNTTYPRTSNS